MYGWGVIEWDGQQSIDLLEVSVPVPSKEKCKNFLEQNIRVNMHKGQICAGGIKGKDACQVASDLWPPVGGLLNAILLKGR